MPKIYKILLYSLSIFILNLALSTESFALSGLTVSPLRSEVNIAPGTLLTGSLTITNSTNKIMPIRLDSEEFKVINQQYDYAFSQESDITKWITFDKNNFSLGVGKKTTIIYNIGVPLSAEPGGRYASIFVGTGTNGKDSSTGSVQRVASLLYINVLGEVSRSGKLISLNTPWLISDKSSWSASIQNSGTTHYRSRYNAKVYSLFGNEVSSFSGDSLVLPGSVRLIMGDLNRPVFPGLYNATYVIGLGDTPAKTQTRLFLYLPFWFMVIVVATLTISILKYISTRRNKQS